jgi:hypothetical protein
MTQQNKPEGWRNKRPDDPKRHSDAARGIESGRFSQVKKPKYPIQKTAKHIATTKGFYAVNIEDIEKINDNHGLHFFDRASMRFFDSRAARSGYIVGDKAYFLTSEQFHDFKGYSAPRKFSLRIMDTNTGRIDTPDGFNKLSKSEAQSLLNRKVNDAIKNFLPEKMEIGVAGGNARYLRTEVEDAQGKWNDSYKTAHGYSVIHEGKKHHVYFLKPASWSQTDDDGNPK